MGEIERLCEEYQVDELSVFGSVLRREPGESSDIDLLVVFKPEARIGLEFVRLQRELSQVIGRNVDLVSKESLKPLIRDRVLAEAQVLYAA
ncbi:MAG: nucleotidyltransferase domain-containing protein [Acidobacteria bacterium]|nr:nucleotidyltransferase domain-containing protein [Acidobacteriota bacterium]